jgi:Na+/proline symporter
MNTTKVNAAIGFTIVIVAGLALVLQGDSSVMLSDASMAIIAGFTFLSIILGMIYWRTGGQKETISHRRRAETNRR